MFEKNCNASPNIISASKESLITSSLELPFHENNELAILHKNMNEMDTSVTSTRDMIIDFADNNVHMNDSDSRESAFKNSSILPQVTLIFPQSNWSKQNQHPIETSNVGIPRYLNKVSVIPQFVNDSRVCGSGILHKADASKEQASIDKNKNSTKFICDPKVSCQNKPSINQNLCFLTQHNSNVPTRSGPELNSPSSRENVAVDLITFETFSPQVWFKDVESSQTVNQSINRKIKARLKCLRPLRPKGIDIKYENDTTQKFPTDPELIPYISGNKLTKPTTTENLIKPKIVSTQKPNSQCTNYNPATKSEGKHSLENKSTGVIVTELPESSAVLDVTPAKRSMDLAESKIEEAEGESDSTINILQFKLLKEMWNTRNKNEDAPELANSKLAQNKLFVALLEEFLKKYNCAKYISQLTGLEEFLQKYNISRTIEDLNDAFHKSFIKRKIERVIGVKIITPSKSFDYSSTVLTNAGQISNNLQDSTRTLPSKNVEKKKDEKIIEKDKLNVSTLELQADRDHKPIGKKIRISNQTTNGENKKQSSRFDATHDFNKCKCNETSVYKVTFNQKKYAIQRCFFNNNFSHNNSMIVRDACQSKPKMTRRRTHCFATACDFIKRNGLKHFQKLFLQPMVKLELIRVPSYRNSLNEMLQSDIENLVLSSGASTTANPGLELQNTNTKNAKIINLMQAVDKISCDLEVQDDRSYIKCMDNKPVCEELVSNSNNRKSNENEMNEACLRGITHPNDNNNLLSSPHSSINDDIDTQLHICRIGDDSPELKLDDIKAETNLLSSKNVCGIGDDSPELKVDEIKAETNLISSENAYRTGNDSFHVANFNVDASVMPKETSKIVETPKKLEITSDTYGPMNSFYIISTPEWVPKSLESQENYNDVMGQRQSLEIENKHLQVDADPTIPLNPFSRADACKNNGETMVHTSVGSPTDIKKCNQTIIVNVQNGDSWGKRNNTTCTPMSSYSSNLNLEGNKSTPLIYGLAPHIIRTENTVDHNGKIPIASSKRKRDPHQLKNLVQSESLNTAVEKSQSTIQSTPVRRHTKSNHIVTKRSKNNISIEQPKQLIKINNPQITNRVHSANSSVRIRDTRRSSMKNVQKERSSRHYTTIKIDAQLMQKTNSREIVAAESTTEDNDPTSNLRITSSANEDVTETALINCDKSSGEDWYDEKEDNESNSKPEYDFQNELYNRYFINLLKAHGYHAKFRYSNTRLAVLSANISNLERAEKFVRTFEKFDSADYMIWRDAKQERYLLHRTWLCAKNGKQKPNVAYKNLPCQARIHISIKRAPDNAHNSDVLIYKEHSHVST